MTRIATGLFLFVSTVTYLAWSSPPLNPSPPLNLNTAESPRELSLAMSVQYAYRAIPHQRTAFELTTSEKTTPEQVYLHLLFQLTDLAVIDRVQTQLWFESDGRRGRDARNSSEIIRRLQVLDAPRPLRKVQQLLTEAIHEQSLYFEYWRQHSDQYRLDANHHVIRSSHAKLLNAYQELMRIFPEETTHNRQAFFDHLCALDFI